MHESFHDYSLAEMAKRILPSHRVLDVGGWHAPLMRANHIIDIMPFETMNLHGAVGATYWQKPHFSRETFVQFDICSQQPWPFPDKFFDFVYCSHTLEDLRDPIRVCSEILRVGRAGAIEVPSRLVESTRGIERPFYCGYYHHRWLCETEGTKITFQFKPAMLHAYRRFHFRKPWNKKINPKYYGTGFFWEGHFDFEEKILIDRGDVQTDLLRFKQANHDRADLFVAKYNWLGQRV